MRTLVAVIVTALITSASAFGATSWQHSAGGITCRSANNGVIGCLPNSGTGYGVGISRNMVGIFNTRTEKMVAVRYQP